MTELSAAELLGRCCAVIDGFQSQMCPEEYIRISIEETELHPDEKFFLIEIFSGTLQYSKALSELLKILYTGSGRNLLQSDRAMLRSLSYLLLFRFEEVLVNQKLQLLLESIEYRKIILLLNLLADEKELKRLKRRWETIYDTQYVQSLLLQPLEANRDSLKAIRDRLERKSSSVGAFVKKAPTVPVEFQLRQKNTIIPEPEEEPKISITTNAIPETTYKTPEYLEKIAVRDREHDRQARVAQLLKSSDLNAFDCAVTDKSEKTLQRMDQIQKDESRKLDFDRKHAICLPDKRKVKNPSIKMTTAALLREEKLYAKREEKSLQELEKLLQGARDDSDFKQWRDKIKEEQLQEQLNKRFENILSGQLSREEAVLAKQKDIDQKKAEADELKKISDKLLRRKELLDQREAEALRRRNQEIAEADRNAYFAKKAVEAENRQLVEEIQRVKNEMWREKQREEEIEKERKRALIREIRQLEAERIEDRNYKLPIDLTSTAGHALLGEMSIAELRERLCLLKEKEEAKEAERRKEIHQAKHRQELRLNEAKRKIEAHRTLLLAEQKQVSKIPSTPSGSRLRELEKKLAERKNQRIKFQQEAKLKTSPKTTLRT